MNKIYAKWEVIDLVFEASTEGNPFRNVEFSAEVIGDNYKKTIQGFYNGDETYIIRLCFDEVGSYSYTTKSNNKALDSLIGTIEVVTAQDNKKLGPIVLNKENPNRLFYQDGSHYNMNAIECDWLFALSYDDQEALTRTKKMIKTIDDHEFNQVIMNVYAYDLQWEKDEWVRDQKIKPEHDFSAREDIFPFMGSNSEPDFTNLNVAFFKHLDNVMALLDQRNIISHLMVYVWNKKVNWPDANTEADNMYFDYVVKRYQAYPNLIWDISKEALMYGRCDMDYLVERIKRLRTMDAYDRLLTVHEYGFCHRYPELVDIITYQTWIYEIHGKMKETLKLHPDKVVHNIEHGGYEESPYQIFTGNYTDPKICLRRSYSIMFAGAYTSYYWQAMSWSIIMLPEEAEVAPHLEYYQYMKQFFDQHDYVNLRVSMKLGHGGYAMSNEDESLILVYVHRENYGVSMGGSELRTGKKASYSFFNTITGAYSESQERVFIQHNQFVSPFDEDSILVIKMVGDNVE